MKHTAIHLCSYTAILLALLIAGCAGEMGPPTTASDGSGSSHGQSLDASCSYFYFLWGNNAEYDGRYEEALEAYEKAAICDPDAD